MTFHGPLYDGQQGVAQQSERADDIGISATGLVFPPASVPAPVVAVLNARPMAPDECKPLFRSPLVRTQTADEVTGFGFAFFSLTHHSGPDSDDAADEGEVCLRRLETAQAEFSMFDSAMVFFFEGKRGEESRRVR